MSPHKNPQPGVLGTIGAGNNEVQLSKSSIHHSDQHGIIKGQWIEVEGSGLPEGTYVTSISGKILTLNNSATESVEEKQVFYSEDIHVQILSGAGTTTLTLNIILPKSITTIIEHAEPGIFATTRFYAENLMIKGFAGAGLYIQGQGKSGIPTGELNANVFSVEDSKFRECRNGIRIFQNDANAGTVKSCDVMENDEYGIVDQSLLGNAYYGLHVSGRYGYKTTVNHVSKSLFSNSYAEGGTKNSFVPNTLVIGGIMGAYSSDDATYLSGRSGFLRTNKLMVGNSISSNRYLFDDFGIRIFSNDLWGSQSNKSFLIAPTIKNRDGFEGLIGFYGGTGGGLINNLVLALSTDKSSFARHNAFLPQGFQLGVLNRNGISGAIEFNSSPIIPSSGKWEKGDRVYNSDPDPEEPSYWICITSSNSSHPAGVWVPMDEIPTP